MKVIDINLLVYAVNRDSPKHTRAKAWLEQVLAGEESVALSWAVLLGFLRLVTNRRILAKPLTIEQAIEVVDGWLAQSSVVTLDPGDEHWSIMRDLLRDVGSAGNLTTDSHLAALAIENGAEFCSTDSDFARFAKLRWTNPIA